MLFKNSGVPTFIWKALNNMPLSLDNGGETTRDFIHFESLN